MNNFTLGSDPEAFLFDTTTQEFIPSEYFIKGSKDFPTKKGDEGYALLCDNFMVEYNIPPASDRLSFIHNVNYGIELIQRELPTEVQIKFIPEADFKEFFILNCESANVFGCAPQENIWNIQTLIPEDIPSTKRFAGGHIHIGMPEIKNIFNKKTDIVSLKRLMTLLDLFVGLPLDILEEKHQYSRSLIYGAPGTFRITSYGIEYRTPSNLWLQSNETIGNMWDSVEKALTEFVNQTLILPTTNELVEAFENKEKALDILNYYQINTNINVTEYA